MRKDVIKWSLRELHGRIAAIDFPEYQREPNVWTQTAKERLIDSMMRQFDIAALYFYDNGDGSFDCVDGRQRIGAIMSFLGENQADMRNNGFRFRVKNEVYEDQDHPYKSLDGETFKAIRNRSRKDKISERFIERFWRYEVSIVILRDSENSSEFNLQFTRLNLGTIVNSGERLHAMVGELRNLCFGSLGLHPFLESIKIPTRRFSREQLAAQIVAQVFALEGADERVGRRFARTRHVDLQILFKRHRRLEDRERAWVERIVEVLDGLKRAFERPAVLRNRAMVLSSTLMAYERWGEEGFDARDFAAFVTTFIETVDRQIKLGLDYEQGYRRLIEFQKHVTQASVEPRAVAARSKGLSEEYEKWQKWGEIRGD